MRRARTAAILAACAVFFGASALAQPTPNISTTLDALKNRTTVRLAPAQFAGERGKYHSLKFSVFYSYPGKMKRQPETLSLEILTVVKASKLDPDLYVVFLVDGEEVFLSSDRSAIPNPVRGKRWASERLVFRLPHETFLKFSRAKNLTVRFDGELFDFAEVHLHSLREFARHLKTQANN